MKTGAAANVRAGRRKKTDAAACFSLQYLAYGAAQDRQGRGRMTFASGLRQHQCLYFLPLAGDDNERGGAGWVARPTEYC